MTAESRKLAEAVRRKIIHLPDKLGDEFFPAHVTVALIDAVLTSNLKYESHVVPRVKKYCDHFSLERIRADKNQLPKIEDQETLSDLIEHYEHEDMTALLGQFKSYIGNEDGYRKYRLKAEIIHCVALELRGIGIETLQDVSASCAESIKCALKPVDGIGLATIHMFLMYTGRDDFVKCDRHVCGFVENALCRSNIDPREAEELVKEAAVELAELGLASVTPRLLDYAIWLYMTKSVRAA